MLCILIIIQSHCLIYKLYQDCITVDGVPYVGHLTSKTHNIYVATGFGKWGMTNAIASIITFKKSIKAYGHT